MTNENSAADPAPRRQRMAGYRPLTTPDQQDVVADDVNTTGTMPASAEPSASEAPVSQAPEQGAGGAGLAANAPPPKTSQSPAPVRKQRMGVQPAASTSAVPDATPADEQPAAPGRKQRMGVQSAASTGAPPAAPVRKQRMGVAPSTSGQEPAPTASGKTRMGAAPAPAASPGATPVAAGGTRQRMGSVQRQETAAGASPAPAQGDSAAPVRSRMGTPTPTTIPTTTPTAGAAARSGSGSTPPTTSDQPAPSGGAPQTGERPAWLKPVAVTAVVLVLALAAVLCARWLRTMEPVQEFIAAYDGHASEPAGAPVGLPAWLGWQHFFNMFFIVLIVRTGLQVRNERKPPGYWTAKKGSFFSPKGNTPKKVSLSQWLHQSLDVFWVLNGLIFIVLLFATGQWMRIVPTSWDIFPNMLSTGIQYVSLDWPTENGWVH
ncbi:MAG TPA: hypothetical protein VHH13_07800, partial [Arthrobacter sp.]|nr:hypothetical protein [Arthrobacter sp.]